MSENKTTETGLFSRINNFLKEKSDERVIKQVLKRSARILTNIVNDAEREIEKLEYDIELQEEVVENSYVDMDVESAKGSEDKYAMVYLDKIKAEKKTLSAMKESLEFQQETKKAAQEELKVIK